MSTVSAWLPTPLGGVRLVANDDALVEAWLCADEAPSVRHPVLDLAAAELRAFLRGDLRAFSVPLAPTGTPFQREVWNLLLTIPYGERRSYLDLARSLGQPGASRAVGAANGRNPLPVFIPCHRVVASNGGLGGYSGGLPNKRLLLEIEGGRRVVVD